MGYSGKFQLLQLADPRIPVEFRRVMTVLT